MTIQQLKYAVSAAEAGSVTEAARQLFIAQSSLSNAIMELEREVGIVIFLRNRSGITVTKEGARFLGYARGVLQQMELLESRFLKEETPKIRFGVSAQHYTFTENAFVDLAKKFGRDRYEFFYNATGTHQIMEDVRNRTSDLGILFLSEENRRMLQKKFKEYELLFYPLFTALPHVFLQKNHPLAARKHVSLRDLEGYPRINFVQGAYEGGSYSEELFSSIYAEKQIRVNDRGAVVNFMLGLNAYTISSGIFPKYLHGEQIIAIPLEEDMKMEIGYILNKKQELDDLGKAYVDELKKYAPLYS